MHSEGNATSFSFDPIYTLVPLCKIFRPRKVIQRRLHLAIVWKVDFSVELQLNLVSISEFLRLQPSQSKHQSPHGHIPSTGIVPRENNKGDNYRKRYRKQYPRLD